MKKFIIGLMVLGTMLLSVPAFALLDDNSTNAAALAAQGQLQGQDQGQAQGQAQGQGQGQGQMQGQAAIAAQGQGQLGIVGQSAKNDQSVSVGGDTQKNVAYVLTAPNTVAGDGQSAASMYSIFGGLNLAESAEYKECLEKIRIVDQMKAAGLITVEVAQVEAWEAYLQMKKATQPRRVLGILWETRGKHILNGFGTLATDSAGINCDNQFGLAGVKMPTPKKTESALSSPVTSEPTTNFTHK